MTFATMIVIIITIICLSVLRLPLDKWRLLCGSYSIRQGINSITVSVLKQPWLIKKGDYRGPHIYSDDNSGAVSICQSDEELIPWVGKGRKHEA